MLPVLYNQYHNTTMKVFHLCNIILFIHIYSKSQSKEKSLTRSGFVEFTIRVAVTKYFFSSLESSPAGALKFYIENNYLKYIKHTPLVTNIYTCYILCGANHNYFLLYRTHYVSLSYYITVQLIDYTAVSNQAYCKYLKTTLALELTSGSSIRPFTFLALP